jgi:hypothetical protein
VLSAVQLFPKKNLTQVRSLSPTSPNNSLGHCASQAIFHLPPELHERGRDPATHHLPVMMFATNAVKVCHSGGGDTNILVQVRQEIGLGLACH